MREGRLGYNSYNKRYGLLSSDLWIDPVTQNRKIFMQFMKPQNGNFGGNLQNVIRKNLQKVEQKENVLRQEN